MTAGPTRRATRRVVVKFGTSLLTAGGDNLDPAAMDDLVRQIAEVRRGGAQIAVVTSGAVAAGRARVGGGAKIRSIAARQALAAIGQAHLVERYDTLLRRRGLTAAQALITRADLTERRGYLNVRNTLLRLLEFGVVPIINENDVVADEELRGGAFGENDGLAALAANLIDADLLILLSDVDGLFDRDPRRHPAARLIAEIADFPAALAAADEAADRVAAFRGRGSMRAKVEAARRAAEAGCEAVIANGRLPDAIIRIARGERPGTSVPALRSHVESRKRWLLSGVAQNGALHLDDGAVRALTRQGRSLLPAGVTSAAGVFERGDAVVLAAAGGEQIGVGISNYSAAEVERIRGRKSSEIEAVLGYYYGAEIVHRNNLALTAGSDANPGPP